MKFQINRAHWCANLMLSGGVIASSLLLPDTAAAEDYLIETCEEVAVPSAPLYRYYIHSASDHFYTSDFSELGYGDGNFVYEGIEAYLPTEDGVTLYRYWHSWGNHIYTASFDELGSGGWGYVPETSPGNVFETQETGTVPLYRWYSGGAFNHFYTVDSSAYWYYGYTYEGIVGYVYTEPPTETVCETRLDLGALCPETIPVPLDEYGEGTFPDFEVFDEETGVTWSTQSVESEQDIVGPQQRTMNIDITLDGNTETCAVTIDFIDVIRPELEISGVEHGGVYNEFPTIDATAYDDVDGALQPEFYLNGEQVEPGFEILDYGYHSLQVTATDAAGNYIEENVLFHVPEVYLYSDASVLLTHAEQVGEGAAVTIAITGDEYAAGDLDLRTVILWPLDESGANLLDDPLYLELMSHEEYGYDPDSENAYFSEGIWTLTFEAPELNLEETHTYFVAASSIDDPYIPAFDIEANVDNEDTGMLCSSEESEEAEEAEEERNSNCTYQRTVERTLADLADPGEDAPAAASQKIKCGFKTSVSNTFKVEADDYLTRFYRDNLADYHTIDSLRCNSIYSSNATITGAKPTGWAQADDNCLLRNASTAVSARGETLRARVWLNSGANACTCSFSCTSNPGFTSSSTLAVKAGSFLFLSTEASTAGQAVISIVGEGANSACIDSDGSNVASGGSTLNVKLDSLLELALSSSTKEGHSVSASSSLGIKVGHEEVAHEVFSHRSGYVQPSEQCSLAFSIFGAAETRASADGGTLGRMSAYTYITNPSYNIEIEATATCKDGWEDDCIGETRQLKLR